MCSLARVDGYRSAMTVAGLDIDERLIRFGDFHLDGGRTIGGQLLDMEDPPTAIFAGSDLQALGVFEAARARGLEVPRDVSVVGYDDIPLAAWLSPALTTVHQPLRRMGEEAARLVLRAAAGMLDTVPRMDLATSLVVRHSTAAPASAHASLFKGETLDSVANVLAWVVLVVAPAVGIAVFWIVHILPEKIAEKKKHPQAKAIQALCILSLFFGGLLWPLAWLWAYSKPVLYKMAYGTDTAEHGDDATAAAPGHSDAEELRLLSRRIAELEARLAGKAGKA